MTSASNRKFIVAAMGLPRRFDSKFLLTRRHAPHTLAWHNKWQVAGGGLEFGETPEEALKREFQEELGVIPKIIFPEPIVKTNIWYGHETSRRFDAQIILITYIVDIGKQRVDISKDDETNKFAWLSLEEIKQLERLPATLEIVEEASKIVKKFHL